MMGNPRLKRLVAAAGDRTACQETGHALVEAAPSLALWMAYEDVARVADLKSRPERFRRIRQESGAVVQKAIADRHFRGTLHLSDDNLGDHRLFDATGGRRSCAVESIPLDSCPILAGTGVDFVKVDTQGAELSILEGMRGILERNRPVLSVLMELSPGLLEKSGCSLEGLLECFEKLQARPHRLGQQKQTVQLTPIGQKDENFYSDLYLRFNQEDTTLA